VSREQSDGRKIADRRRTEAASWHVRLNSSWATEADFLAFETWVSYHQNRAAYDALDRLSVEIDASAEALQQALARDNVVDLPAGRSRVARRTWFAGAVAVAAAAVLTSIVLPRPAPDHWITLTAVRSETRNVALEDGSSVHLNRGSSVRVAFSARLRRVNMAESEAAFNVAHDAERPFRVEVGDERVTVEGTEFNVLNLNGRTVVTVRRGVVTVSPRASRNESGGVRLLAGDQFVHDKGSDPVVTRQVGAEASFAWQSGLLVYSDAPLTQVVFDLNRYFERPVRIDGSDAGALRFSGVIAIDSDDRVIERLESFLPIEASESENEYVLRRKRKR